MRKWVCLLSLAVFVAAPAAAQDRSVKFSFGYAFAKYLEEGGGSAPVGAYLSIASSGRQFGLEADLAYHRDSEEFFGESLVLNTVTATVGPHFELGSGGARPFLHVLGGLRYDSIEDESNTSWGFLAGGGADVPVGGSISLRLGIDYEMFFDEGENLKTLRLNAGITF